MLTPASCLGEQTSADSCGICHGTEVSGETGVVPRDACGMLVLLAETPELCTIVEVLLPNSCNQ